MSGGIFISYRRGDDKHAAGRLHLLLAQVFPRDQIFMDVTAIEPGLDFVEVLQQKVASCRVMLVVIGRGWLADLPRLQNPKDFVRIEIEAALARKVRVVPVLIDGVEIVPPDGLPDELKPLSNRQAIRLSHTTFDNDAAQLMEVLKKEIPPARKEGLFGNWRRDDKPKMADRPKFVASPPPASKPTAPAHPADQRRTPLAAALFAALAPAAVLGWQKGLGYSIDENITLGLVIAAALVLALPRRASLSATDVALYWLGCVLTVAITIALGHPERTQVPGYGFLSPANLAATGASAIPALLLAWRTRADSAALPGLIYWCGVTLSAALVMLPAVAGPIEYHNAANLIATVSIGFSFLFAALRWSRLSTPEATIYWLGAAGGVAIVAMNYIRENVDDWEQWVFFPLPAALLSSLVVAYFWRRGGASEIPSMLKWLALGAFVAGGAMAGHGYLTGSTNVYPAVPDTAPSEGAFRKK